jgi:hypothetical protein
MRIGRRPAMLRCSRRHSGPDSSDKVLHAGCDDAGGRMGTGIVRRNGRQADAWHADGSQAAAPQADARAGLPARWPQIVLSVWSALYAAVWVAGTTGTRHGIAWRAFLVPGSRMLFGGPAGFSCPGFPYSHLPGGLHLYASYPCLQIGPLAFVVAEPIRFLGPHGGLVVAELIMSLIGLAILLVIGQIMAIARPELLSSRAAQWTLLAGGALFLVAWETVAVGDGHLDDVLALLFAALAVLAGLRGRPVLTGLALGLSVAAKPWGLIFLPVLLLTAGIGAWRAANLAGRPVRDSLRPCLIAAVVAAAVAAATWLPFLLADPATTSAFHFAIYNSPGSGLRVLGVNSKETPPWDRTLQIGLGCLLGSLAVWRGRWPAVLLLGAGARIGLDPGIHEYYTPGVLMGALLWDLVGTRRPFPLWTVLSYCALNVVPVLTIRHEIRGDARLGIVIVFTLVVLLAPARWCWRPAGRAASRAGSAGPPQAIVPALPPQPP